MLLPTCDHSPPGTNHAYGRIPVDALHVPRRGTYIHVRRANRL